MSLTQELKTATETATETATTVPEDVIFTPRDLLSDEPPLETDLHRLQMTLLIQCLE